MDAQSRRVSRADEQTILAYYERAAPLIASNFPHAPLVAMYYPHGLDQDATFSGAVHEPLPHTIPSITATTSSGEHRYPACAENTILWLAHRYAVGFLSWFPSAANPDAVSVAHIGLRPVGGATQEHLKEAMLALRAALHDVRLDAIPVLHGNTGAALFLPCSDAPAFDEARTLLHHFVEGEIARRPTLLVHEKRPHEQYAAPRVECTVVANAVGRGCLVPYSLNGTSRLPMVTPIEWNELGTIANGDVTAATAHDRLAKGDVYADHVRALAGQRLSELAR